ncbi:MAG TPA: class I SAM-dependent methyltransferase, partial [Gaiellaceae bacterium]|nr:class I SAM-dependent methyltransferase [Gaiellaceae bacterium]
RHLASPQMDLRDYYDRHWTEVPEGEVDYSRLQLVLDEVEPGQHVLDSGCGPGFLAELLKKAGVDVVGTDVSAVGPTRTAARGIDARQVDLDTDPLPFEDGSFDAVIANSNLEHLFYMRRHIAECARCVRPGGKLIWLVPNIGHWRYRLWLLSGRFPYIPNSPTDEYHIRYVTAHEAKKLVRGAGLRVVRLDGHAGTWCRGLYPRIFTSRFTKRYVDRLYEPLVRLRPSLFARYLCLVGIKEPAA